jgi:Ca2+-binding EF-hand superfamily protein
MDLDNDGVVTRSEWRGSDRSFDVHDWNADGVLSGDEVRPGAIRNRGERQDEDFDSPHREYVFNDWTPNGFNRLDRNRDGRISAAEWYYDREGFRRADHNGDGVVSRREFLGEDAVDDDRDDRFGNLDVNRDGRIARSEWHGAAARFDALDVNRDGYLSRSEVMGTQPPANLFESVDANRDGTIARTEWAWSRRSFDQRDTNRDGRLTREEFLGTAALPTQGQTYRAGYDRGVVDGRAAGREDRQRNQGWDLEGQRELETATAGYDPRIGPRDEYQRGYRDGFRRAYREGFELR